uniref:Ig-like domain-containing protein n=1 Tax=Neolamprologus brichardi TaxID=32507 RepID=A0A3Q4G598_NEOBR
MGRNANHRYKAESRAWLRLFLPSEVVVDEGEDAALPCRSITAGQRVKTAQWRRDGEVVLELNPPQVTYGNGFESRVSIPSDWFQRADLSLSIKRVQLRDRGVYFCDVDKAERHRSAVRLRVREIVPESLTSTLKPTLMVSTLTLRPLSHPPPLQMNGHCPLNMPQAVV